MKPRHPRSPTAYLDAALRRLAARAARDKTLMPDLDGIELTATRLLLHLAAPTDLPHPWQRGPDSRPALMTPISCHGVAVTFRRRRAAAAACPSADSASPSRLPVGWIGGCSGSNRQAHRVASWRSHSARPVEGCRCRRVLDLSSHVALIRLVCGRSGS